MFPAWRTRHLLGNPSSEIEAIQNQKPGTGYAFTNFKMRSIGSTSGAKLVKA